MLPHLTHSGKGMPPTLSASLGDGLQLSSSGAVLTLPAPESVPPSPGIRGTVLPITGFGFLGVLGVGSIAAWDSLEKACGKQSLTFTPVFLNHRKCGSWVFPVSPASSVTLLTTGKSQRSRVDLQGSRKQTHPCSAVNFLHG